MSEWNNRRVGAEDHPLNAETVEREARWLREAGHSYPAEMLRKAWAEIERLRRVVDDARDAAYGEGQESGYRSAVADAALEVEAAGYGALALRVSKLTPTALNGAPPTALVSVIRAFGIPSRLRAPPFASAGVLWNKTADQWNQWADLSGDERDAITELYERRGTVIAAPCRASRIGVARCRGVTEAGARCSRAAARGMTCCDQHDPLPVVAHCKAPREAVNAARAKRLGEST